MRPMDDVMLARHLENLDRRLAKVEQILPALASEESLRRAVAQLATKEELRLAIAPLATKEELRLAVAPLATKEELHEESERLRRHMDVLSEAQRADIQLLAEHLSVVLSKLTGS
jgi:uncharacterized protein YicC (UPF0701 family)